MLFLLGLRGYLCLKNPSFVAPIASLFSFDFLELCFKTSLISTDFELSGANYRHIRDIVVERGYCQRNYDFGIFDLFSPILPVEYQESIDHLSLQLYKVIQGLWPLILQRNLILIFISIDIKMSRISTFAQGLHAPKSKVFYLLR